MSTTIPEGAASPSAAQAPPPAVAIAVAVAPAAPTTRIDHAKAKVEKLGGMLTILAGIGGTIAAGVATSSGAVEWVYDKLTSTSQTQSQVTAMDERLKLVEADKAAIEKDRQELARLGRSLDDLTRDLARTGVDVGKLEDLQRQIEIKVERMDAILGTKGRRS